LVAARKVARLNSAGSSVNAGSACSGDSGIKRASRFELPSGLQKWLEKWLVCKADVAHRLSGFLMCRHEVQRGRSRPRLGLELCDVFGFYAAPAIVCRRVLMRLGLRKTAEGVLGSY
jgi:hypothetical protein